MSKQETAKMAVEKAGVKRPVGRRDIPVNTPKEVETVTYTVAEEVGPATMDMVTVGDFLALLPPMPARARPRPVVPMPKLMQFRQALGAPVPDGIKATLEELMADPSKFEGKAFQMTSKRPVYVQGWGEVRPTSAQFLLKGMKRSVYAHGLLELEGSNLHFNGSQFPTLTAGAMEVEEVHYNREDMVRAEVARQVKMANTKEAIGADPEIFAEDGEGNLVPAFEFLPSVKEATHKTKGYHERYGAGTPFWDGYQAEFNTVPDTCLAYHSDSVREGLVATLQALKTKYPNGKLSVKTTMDIPPERLTTDDPKYVMFGCTPSKSVYGETFPEVDAATIPFRSAGGHLHFTMPHAHAVAAVKELDRILGVICVGLFQYYDDPRRRLLYGRAGEYRKPKYGIEYRTLSNAWLIHPATSHFVYEIGRRCIGLAEKGGWGYWKTDEDKVRKCINECDVGLMKEILTENMDALRVLLESLPTNEYAGTEGYVDRWIEVIFNGIHTVLTNPDELSHTWYLEEDVDKGQIWIGHSEGTCGNFSRAMEFMMANEKGMID